MMVAKGPLHEETPPIQVGEVKNSSTKGSVLLLDIFSGTARSNCSIYTVGR